MIPRYARQVGPQVAGRQYAGLADRASASIGGAVAGWGVGLMEIGAAAAQRSDLLASSRAWRAIDDWRIQYLRSLPERRRDLAATSIDEQTGGNVTGYERELTAFPDAMKARFEEATQGLSRAAREQLEVRYNEAVPQWSAEVTQTLDGMELGDIVTEARDLADQGRAAEGLELADLYQDRLGPERHRQLAGELLVAGAQADLQEVARAQGWEAARAALQDPAWQEVYGLDVSEAEGLRRELAGFVRDEGAVAERKAAVEQDLLERQRIDEAYQGAEEIQIGDEAVPYMDRVRQEYLAGAISKETFEQVRKIRTEGARTQNDPETYAAYVDLKDAVARGAQPASDLSRFAREHASLLTPATNKEAIEIAGSPFTMQSQAKNDAIQRAYGQFVRIQETDLASLLTRGASKEAVKSAGDMRAQQLNLVNMVSDELEAWLSKNPDATRADILRKGREIQVLLSGRSIDEQDAEISRWQSGAAGPRGAAERAVQGVQNMLPAALRTPLTALTPLTESTTGSPAGLESVWEQLSTDEQASAMRMLNRGVSAAEILAALQGGG